MKRLPLPDLLKGFAVFLIVPVHILETLIDYPGRETLFGKILLFLGGPVAVPVFMMVMGYFMAKNRKSVQQNLWRGIKVFGVGFLLNIGLNFHLLLKIRFAGWQIDSLEYISATVVVPSGLLIIAGNMVFSPSTILGVPVANASFVVNVIQFVGLMFKSMFRVWNRWKDG